MFAFKKEYRPIQGQKWWEKILDIATRVYPLCQIEIVVYSFAFFGGMAIWVLDGGLKMEFPRPVALALAWGEVGLVFLSFVLSGIEWIGKCVESSVKGRVSERIEQYIKENISCSYDELICAVMKVRIHRGFDEALEEFEHERKIAVLDGICRLPTGEDKRRWRDEDVEIYGVSFEELEQIFAHPIEWFGRELRIEFSLWEEEEHRLEKEWNAQTDAEMYVCTVAGGERREFSSFAELADAPLFGGQNLREVCGRIVVSYANGFSWPPEFFDRYCTD